MGYRALLILLLASSGLSYAFERPWEDEGWVASNPNIFDYGVQLWWNLPELGKTLDSLDFDDSGAAGATAQDIISAENSIRDARSEQLQCIFDVLGGIGAFPTDPSMLFFKAFGGSSACTAYQRSWKAAVGSALDASEESVSAATAALQDARMSYAELKSSGICLENYSGAGSEDCPELNSAFLAIDSNITEGRYGKHALMLSYSSELESSLESPVPDLSAAPSLVSMVWGQDGFLSDMESLKEKSGDAIKSADSDFHSLEQSGRARRKAAQELLDGMDAAGFAEISRGVEGGTASAPGAISERLSSAASLASSLSLRLDEASIEHGLVAEPYHLATSITLAREADGGYSSLIKSLEALDHDAKVVVSQQRDEATEEVSAAEGSMGGRTPGTGYLSLLSEAKDEIDAGDAAAKPGDSFRHYLRSAALARSASSSGTASEEAESRASISSLEDLIDRAERDGINTAMEKEDLELLKKLPPAVAEDEAERASSSIISKARIIYEDKLLAQRSALLDKISLAGPGAADLLTDVQKAEGGFFQNSSLDFPASVGHLGKIRSEFERIGRDVDAYMGAIVGNSFSVSGSPIVLAARLDEPSEIVLDAVLANDRPYNATGVVARIHLPSEMDFLYSDITSGKDWVDSLRMEDGGKTIALSLPKVAAYETKRLTLAKSAVVAHTISRNSSAEGIGNGEVKLSESIVFSLDYPLAAASLASAQGGSTIDGSSKAGMLARGEHTLKTEKVVHDGYSESVNDISVYAIGTNSKVEFAMVVEPFMDIDSVPLVITSLNDSRIKSFDVVPPAANRISGERRLSDTRYALVLHDLKKGGNVSVRVSYIIEDTESFVKERIWFLGSANLSGPAKEAFDKAAAQAADGNYSKALELVEETVSLAEKAEKADEKERARCDSARSALLRELSEINSSLPEGLPSDPFLQKMDSRKAELQRLRTESEAGGANCSETLAGYDDSWLGKAIDAFRKSSYARYNDLKERLYKAGNVSTPAEFIAVEESLARLESGPRLEYAAGIVASMSNATAMVEAKEAGYNASKAAMKASFESAAASVESILQRYSSQASAAKGTDYSSLFNESAKSVEKLIKDAEAALAGDPRIFWSKLDELNRSSKRMEATLAGLDEEAESRISMLERLLSENQLDDQAKASISSKLSAIRRSAASGDYVNALRAASSLSKELDQKKPQDNNSVLIAVTAFAALGGALLYVMREKPKKMRKLPSSDPTAALLQGPGDSQSRT